MTSAIQQLLDLGLQYHQAGDLANAERLYRQVLDADPRNAAGWHFLGAVAYAVGNLAAAAEYMQRSVDLRPEEHSYLSNWGLVLTVSGRLDEAESALRRALERKPDDADAWMKLGNVKKARRDLPGAEADYRQALALDPRMAVAMTNLGAVLVEKREIDSAVVLLRESLALAPHSYETHQNLGLALEAQGKDSESESHLRRAIELAPNVADTLLSLAMLLLRSNRTEESLRLCRRALELAPAYARAHGCLGAVYSRMQQIPAAIGEFQEAIRLRPDDYEAHAALCVALRDLGRFELAIEHGRRAVELSPRLAAAHDNLGTVYTRMGAFAEALACFDRANEHDPEYGLSHFHRALIWLVQGRYADGWREYEWRWRHPQALKLALHKPRWQGEPLEGRTILLRAEQGFGDTLHFIRYAPRLRQRGATVILECPPALKRFLAPCRGVDRIVVEGEPIPECDYYCPLLSLPGPLNATPGDPPAEIPYLFPEPALVDRWKEELARLPGFRVGLAWQGDPKHGWDRFRSLALRDFAPLAQVAGVRLVSLQRGPGEDQLPLAGFPIDVFSPPLDADQASFCDTAAVMKGLHLVICSDTSIAHLAGGLGVPTWVLLNTSPDWRWGMDGETTDWYPTMRLFRQSRLGDWRPVFEKAVEELRALVAANLTVPGRTADNS